MTPQYDRVCIIGVGLLGASVGLALKARGLAGHINGVGHRQSSLDAALSKSAIDEAFLEVAPGVKEADLIVLATPANLVIPKLQECLAACPAHAIITDVASTKAEICDWASKNCPKPRRFVGAHPIAGSEKFGPEHGFADLYAGKPCVIENSGDIAPEVHAAIIEFWKVLDATIVEMDPQVHDKVLARISHVPHILATSIATLADRYEGISAVIGSGYLDMTRVAAGRPEIWRDIVISNADAIYEAIGELQVYLRDFAEAIEARDPASLEKLFEAGKQAREKAVEE